MKLYRKNSNTGFNPINHRDFAREGQEKTLETWLAENPQLLGEGLILIGRQVRTPHGIIDLLAIDAHGYLHIIELKRGRSSRKVVGQLNSYLTIVRDWNEDVLAANSNLLPEKRAAILAQMIKQRFGLDTAPKLNRRQIGIIVAESLDPDLPAHLKGLRFQSRALQFTSFTNSDGDEYLLMQSVFDSVKLAAKPKARKDPSAPTRAISGAEQGLMDTVARWVSTLDRSRTCLTTAEISENSFGTRSPNRSQAIAIAKALRRLAWTRGYKRINRRLTRVYFRASPEKDLSILGELV